MKPITQIYAFFDGEDVTKYCTPKLLEIEMSSGTFQVGETVIGNVQEQDWVVTTLVTQDQVLHLGLHSQIIKKDNIMHQQ